MTTKIDYTFPIKALRKMPDPIDDSKLSRYFAVVNVSDLPSDIPMETNPRKQNLKTQVAKKIAEGLLGHESGQLFHLLNRGLLISADSVSFDNKNNQLTLKLPNKEKHGLVDGGHTYKIILENKQNMAFDQFITIEIMTGIEEDFQQSRAREILLFK